VSSEIAHEIGSTPALGRASTANMTKSRNPLDLTGKVALITGGNSGLGLGFAIGIAKAGGDVVIWGRRATENEKASTVLRQHGARVLTQTVDVSVEQEVIAGIRVAVAQMGRLDCVIANAGFNSRFPSFHEMPTDAYHALLAVNQHGAFYTLREGVRHMVARAEANDPGGSLIVCGSLAAVRGRPQIQHYAAAKGALMSVTRCIAVEYGRYGIRANMILPGRIESKLGDRSDAEFLRRQVDMKARNPIPRSGTPVDLEGIAVYLMSDAAAYHTGDMITIDGGRSIGLG
jgi:NAD(P)-dependent dehydrogenase (short-subunit alcohol dehydrogenase family)